MKLGIFQIGDMHIKKETNLSHLVEKTANVIASKGVERVFIALVGDIAFSGQKEEYERADSFLNELKKKIAFYSQLEESKVAIIMVPGNHDVQYSEGECLTRKQMCEAFGKNVNKKYIQLCKEKIQEGKRNNYYNFEKKYFLDDSLIPNNPLLKYVSFELDERNTIGFYLYDNSVYSTYYPRKLFEDSVTDTSIGLIPAPITHLDQITMSRDNYRVLLMHFPTWYYREESQTLFKDKILPNLSLTLCGHLHDQSDLCYGKGYNRYVSVSGPYNARKDDGSIVNQFSLITIDTKDNTQQIESFDFVNNGKHRDFVRTNDTDEPKELINFGDPNVLFSFRESYKAILKKDYLDISPGLQYDYYVFPGLKKVDDTDGEDQKTIDVIDDFFEVTNEKKVIVISGSESQGKTVLLKHLQMAAQEKGKYSLFFRCSELKKGNEKRFREYLAQEIAMEYEDDNYFDRTIQKQRVAFVDDVDLIEQQSFVNLLSFLKKSFGMIVMTIGSHHSSNLVVLGEADAKYDIRSFKKKKREQLIEKVFEIMKEARPTQQANVRSIKNSVETLYSKLSGVMTERPETLVLFTKNAFNGSSGVQADTREYNSIFEEHVISLISRATEGNAEKVNLYHKTLLPALAYSLIKNYTEYRMPYDDFEKLIEKIENDKGFDSINKEAFVNSLESVGILMKNVDNTISFPNRSYNAYYASAGFIRGSSEDKAWLLQNIFSGINVNVFLFLILRDEYRYDEYIELVLENLKTEFGEELEKEPSINEIHEASYYLLKEDAVEGYDPVIASENLQEIKKEAYKRNSVRMADFIKHYHYLTLLCSLYSNFAASTDGKCKKTLAHYIYLFINKCLYIESNFSEEEIVYLVHVFSNKIVEDNKSLGMTWDAWIKDSIDNTFKYFLLHSVYALNLTTASRCYSSLAEKPLIEESLTKDVEGNESGVRKLTRLAILSQKFSSSDKFFKYALELHDEAEQSSDSLSMFVIQNITWYHAERSESSIADNETNIVKILGPRYNRQKLFGKNAFNKIK